ncbi:MAG: hypothetical protein NUV56_02940, partial [Candidatus Uhrbacteria bacterium]|nr:hypothetical protein [Candidatus Uhrbacteria bacterium]
MARRRRRCQRTLFITFAELLRNRSSPKIAPGVTMIRFLSIISLAPLFTACTGNSSCSDCVDGAGSDLDSDSGSCSDCPNDTGDDTKNPGYLEVGAMIMGSTENCQVVINGKVVGNTGDSIELEPGT